MSHARCPRQFVQALLFSLAALLPLSAVAQADKHFTNSIGMAFVLIPAGSFNMGANPKFVQAYDDEKPQHPVRISRPFFLGKYPVTQDEWVAVMGENPSKFKGGRRPVENVSWDDAQTFIQRLNAKEGTESYRLPTEAEWEYAAQAGTKSVYSFGDDVGQLGQFAWYDENAGNQTHPVGQKKPNPWGLYDMYGNVWEWVEDWYDATYYRRSPESDPRGPASGVNRVVRGGCWYFSAIGLRSSVRYDFFQDGRFDSFGLRLARSADRQALNPDK
ncbi:hypothetical protein FACS1894116_06630 [Betaproteobacteria bacterium]|nr:hypothetical protein AGMMS49543_18670 [Betaproteobacteria bacterium]GHT93813.1 hypothetical protein FACS1894116_06630 [Betaproteobacteria bacterium]GHU04406.1 hypothetical protein AGMMS49960_20050 [Betaproteobacteria bacterium]GHU08422.1 hypothetical protein AGMMS50225_07040 [Betaproteobacteria bacterium]GHU18976.1 hypothetical protein AGMMS50243_10020 [Betaproteobacteria bacterium]